MIYSRLGCLSPAKAVASIIVHTIFHLDLLDLNHCHTLNQKDGLLLSLSCSRWFAYCIVNATRASYLLIAGMWGHGERQPGMMQIFPAPISLSFSQSLFFQSFKVAKQTHLRRVCCISDRRRARRASRVGKIGCTFWLERKKKKKNTCKTLQLQQGQVQSNLVKYPLPWLSLTQISICTLQNVRQSRRGKGGGEKMHSGGSDSNKESCKLRNIRRVMAVQVATNRNDIIWSSPSLPWPVVEPQYLSIDVF